MNAHASAAQKELGYATLRRQIEAGRSARAGAPAGVVRIPVVVHIVQHADDKPVSDGQVREQITSLNLDFRAANADRFDRTPEAFQALIADVGIEFGLARRDPAGRPTDGILRQPTGVKRFPEALGPDDTLTERIDRELKLSPTGSAAWPFTDYMNVWVCNMSSDPLGYATLPGAAAWRDGIVIDVKCFGSSGTAAPPFDLGRTLTHEVGHWLDLLHIWGEDRGGCESSDNIADTPNQGGPNKGVPEYPKYSCGNHPYGDLFMNYMDYVDDEAMVMFTREQARRMQETVHGARSSVLRSRGLDAPLNPAGEAIPKIIARSAFSTGAPAAKVFDGVSWVNA